MLAQQIWRYVKTVMGIVFRHPITGTTVVAELIEGGGCREIGVDSTAGYGPLGASWGDY